VTAEKTGYYVHYRINARTLQAWRRMANDLLRAGAASRARGS
jgi:hypothetical protein